jgi:hypothetical protein
VTSNLVLKHFGVVPFLESWETLSSISKGNVYQELCCVTKIAEKMLLWRPRVEPQFLTTAYKDAE